MRFQASDDNYLELFASLIIGVVGLIAVFNTDILVMNWVIGPLFILFGGFGIYLFIEETMEL